MTASSTRPTAPFPVVQHPAGLLAQLSASAADDDNWEASPEYLQFLEAKYRDIECPLFLDELPRDVSSNPQLEALQALAYEGETPLSVVRRCREKGREALEEAAKARRGGQRKEYACKVKEAEEAYTVALQQGIQNQKELSLLHSNLALCYLKRGALLQCIDSARRAIRCDPSNLKAYMRGSKASMHLELFAQAARFADMGLQAVSAVKAEAAGSDLKDTNSTSTDLASSEAELHGLLEEAKLKHRQHEQRRREAEERAKNATQIRSPSVKDVLASRGVKFLSIPSELKEFVSQLPEPTSVFEPLSGDWVLLLPLVILLDEFRLAEAITNANERLSLQQQLANVFPSKFALRHLEERRAKLGEKADKLRDNTNQTSETGFVAEYPPWDSEKKYCVEDLVAFYDGGLPGGVLLSFPMDLPIALLIQRAGQIAGVACFHVLVKHSPAHEAFLRENRVEPISL